LTLSKVIEDGKVLVPVFGPDLTGMENLGNSCYINSVVQLLFSFPEFRNFYEPNAAPHLKFCCKSSPDCYQCQIFKLAQGLYSGEYSQKKLAVKVETEDGTKAED